MDKSGPPPIPYEADEETLSNFYAQALLEDPLRYCSQDVNRYLKYQNDCLNQDVSSQKASKRTKETSKKKDNVKNKTCNSELNSYIIKKIKKGKRIIKISISNLELDNESKEVAVQYVVEGDFDEMLNATEELVDKIVKRLRNVNY